MKLFLIIFLIIILFFIFNNIFTLEHFEKEESGLVCGTQNDVCYQSSCGTDSCCDNYKCVLPNGDYQYKICVRKSNIFANMPYISGISMKKSKFPKLAFPKISFPRFDICPAVTNLKKYKQEEEEEENSS